jgi:hypothetical protein
MDLKSLRTSSFASTSGDSRSKVDESEVAKEVAEPDFDKSSIDSKERRKEVPPTKCSESRMEMSAR